LKADLPTATDNAAEQSLAIARQPVYNDQMGVFGYELLFRPSVKGGQIGSSAEATAHVLTSVMLSAGLDEIVYNRKAIINITRAFIDVLPQVPLPPEQLMLDIPDNIRVDEVLLKGLRGLKDKGYELSIGGFGCLREPGLLSIADNFRVDVKKLDVERLDRLTKFLRRYRNLSLRALKIETLEEYDLYRTRGYDLFQGYFLGSPRTHRVRDLSANKLAVMDLLATVHNLEIPIETLEEKIVRDVSLSFKLMKLVNSPFFGVASEVDSVKRAVVLLGRDEIRKMVSLLALSGSDDQPRAMVEIALMRAKTCELLGQRLGVPGDGFFTVGMFSALDVLMEQPIRKIVTKLPLNEEIRKAILNREGIMGEALTCAMAMERAQWSDIHFSELDERDLFGVSVEALQWTNGVIRHL
jgi:EAL and modified HD-GYP domain-containing signal transduction protein